MHSALKWSTAPNTQPQPSSAVKTRNPSAPHITFGAFVVIVPLCNFASRCRVRCGESSRLSRIRRSTRFLETRIPL